MNYSYEFGSESTSYYGGYRENPGMDFSRRAWEYPLMMNAEESIAVDVPSQQDMVSIVHPIAEESKFSLKRLDLSLPSSMQVAFFLFFFFC